MKEYNQPSKREIKQLIRLAFITSPIIGIYAIVPMLVFLLAQPENQEFLYFIDSGRILIGISVISASFFLQWLFNIILFRILDRREIFQKNSWLKYIASYLFIIVLIAVMSQVTKNRPNVGFVPVVYPYIGGLTNNTFIILLIAVITSKNQRIRLEIEKAKLEVLNVKAQQEDLKHKIHPHFLFNSLNTLRILIGKEPKKAENYVLNLSSFLRFSISESVKDTALIKDEMQFCLNYIDMHRVRYSDAIRIKYDLPEEIINNCHIPVFTLQILAENAIKHNAFSKNTPLFIELLYNKDGTLTFKNNLIFKKHEQPTTKTGLHNLKQRFELLGNKSFITKRDETQNEFSVSFKPIVL